MPQCVDDVLVDSNVILEARQALGERADADTPRVHLSDHLLEAGAPAGKYFACS